MERFFANCRGGLRRCSSRSWRRSARARRTVDGGAASRAISPSVIGQSRTRVASRVLCRSATRPSAADVSQCGTELPWPALCDCTARSGSNVAAIKYPVKSLDLSLAREEAVARLRPPAASDPKWTPPSRCPHPVFVRAKRRLLLDTRECALQRAGAPEARPPRCARTCGGNHQTYGLGATMRSRSMCGSGTFL